MAKSISFGHQPCIVWKIEDFFSTDVLESDVFQLDGSQWRLVLEKELNFSGERMDISLRKIYPEESTHEFDIRSFIEGRSRTPQFYNKYIRNISSCSHAEVWWEFTEDLQNKIDEILVNNILTFVCVFTSTTTGRQDTGIKQSSNYLDMEYLSQDFLRLLDGGMHPDITLRCMECNVPAHRALLAARSEVFAAMFESDMLEKRSGYIDIVDIDFPVLKELLRYIYTGKLSNLSQDTAPTLYEAADKYALDSLKKRCADFMLDRLTEQNACDLLVLADAHSDKELKDCIVYFMVEKAIPLQEDIWHNFSENHTKLAMEVLHNAFKAKYAFPSDKLSVSNS